MRSVFALLVSMCVSIACFAETWSVDAVGQATVFEGRRAEAREQAVADALHRAMMSKGGEVSGQTVVMQRTQVLDTTTLKPLGKVTHWRLLSEDWQESTVKVRLQVELEAGGICAGRGGLLHKRVLFTSFKRSQPAHSTLGALHNVDEALPNELMARGYHSGAVNGTWESAMSGRIAPDSVRAIDFRRLAQASKAQFVLTGEVVSMAMQYPRQYAEASKLGYFAKRTWRAATSPELGDAKNREFSMTIRLYDGLSGALVFSKEYGTSGRWLHPRNRSVGFGSVEFWSGEYGAAVSQTLDQAVADVTQKVTCQPVKAPIRMVAHDGGAYLDLGANNGLRVGDVFQVARQESVIYQGANYAQVRAQERFHLQPLSSSAVVTQVYEQYARIRLSEPLRESSSYVGIIW